MKSNLLLIQALYNFNQASRWPPLKTYAISTPNKDLVLVLLQRLESKLIVSTKSNLVGSLSVILFHFVGHVWAH